MKPAPFEYRAPTSVGEAVAILAEHGDDAHVLAGGQSLLPMMALRLARPSMLVDVGRIAELGGVANGNGLCIGAGVTQRTVERSRLVAERCPLLHQAVPLIAHPPIRTRGTIGGSLAHADPAAELPAVATALDAEVVLRHAGGERVVPIARFFQGYLTTDCRPGELVVEIRFPEPAPHTGTAFVEISRRHGDFAIVGCAAVVSIDAGRVIDARIALAGVDMVPVRAGAAEAALKGEMAGPALWRAAAEQAKADLRPSSDIHATGAYRRHVAGVLTARALASAAGGSADGRAIPMSEPFDVELTVNGEVRSATVEARRNLADLLRYDLGLTGTHLGCEHGVCGVCTVLVDDEPVRSCLMLAVQAQDRRVTTVEGLGSIGSLHVLQQAMWDSHSFQCGFCTPGFLMAAVALLAENPAPTESEIRTGLAGNLCRCTGYQSIVDGVALGAARQRGEPDPPDPPEHCSQH